jgi:2-hydroxy-3-oxopropionate reductase
MTTLKVGFIGLGIMGKPMSKNLLIKAGYSLVVLDRTIKRPLAELMRRWARKAPPRRKRWRNSCDVVITMLPNSPQVTEVALGENGLLEGRSLRQLTLIDMSSIAPLASREICTALAGQRNEYVGCAGERR